MRKVKVKEFYQYDGFMRVSFKFVEKGVTKMDAIGVPIIHFVKDSIMWLLFGKLFPEF